MKRLFLIFVMSLLATVLAAQPAMAKPQIIAWDWPTADCEGLSLAEGDLISSELIFDTAPMPMPSDTSGPCAAQSDPGPPATATVVPLPVTDTSVTLNLKPGETYFARVRVSAYVGGNWASWSAEHEFTVPYGRPNQVIITSGLVEYSSFLITDPVIRLN